MSLKTEYEYGAAPDGDTIQDSRLFRDGDFELISSDNVRFRVPSCYLIAASKVFRDMSSVNGPQHLSVTFTDRDIETSGVLDAFLHILCFGQVPNVDGEFEHLRELATFLHKYGCTQVRQLVIYALESAALQGRGNSLRLFAVAVTLQAPALCVLIVKSRAGETWHAPLVTYPPSKETGVPGMNVWNPQGWPESFWALHLPHTYMFALARASGMHGELEVNFERCLRGQIGPKYW